MLKMTKVELEKIGNPDIHLFIERGGISYINKRYSKANNEYCPDYDKNKSKVYINYLDMNNLYGKAMREYLPYGGFKWVKVNNETINRVLNKSDNSLHGHFLEGDLYYPEKLHAKRNDYLMAWEKIKIEEEMLSPSSLEIKKENNIKVGGIKKLVPNVMSKKNCCSLYCSLDKFTILFISRININKGS